MKKYQYIFVRALMIILVCMATSCGNDDTDEPPVDDMLKFGEWTYISKDGSLLNSVNLTIHKVPENETLSKEGEVTHTYAIDSYEDLAFMLYFQQDFVTDYIAANGQRENFEEVIRRAIKYEWNKWLYIKKDSEKFESNNTATEAEIYSWFYFAYVDEAPKITCDKKLFGLEAGSDLSNHFQVRDDVNRRIRCIPQGIEKPGFLYRFGDELPRTFNEYFSDKSWISELYFIQPVDKPAEQYDELTFHLTFPLILEHTTDYAIEQFKGGKPERKFSKRVLETDCHVVFRRN